MGAKLAGASLKLQKRGQTFYAKLEIPPSLHAHFGRPRFIKSTGCRDERQAWNRGRALESEWRRLIDNAHRALLADPNGAEWWASRIKAAPPEAKSDIVDRINEEALELAFEKVGDWDPERWDRYEDWQKAIAEDRDANRFHAAATGQYVRFDAFIKDWEKTLKGVPRTNAQKVSTARHFANEFTYVQDVTRKAVQKWVERQSQDLAKSRNTISRNLSELRAYWAYLVSIEEAPADLYPFDKLSRPTPNHKEARTRKRLAFDPADVVRLHAAATANGNQPLADLISLAMWTGARRSELGHLKVEDIRDKVLQITDSKTESGIRQLPIHPALQPIIERLIGDRKTGQLIQEAASMNKYNMPATNLGTAFGRLKADLGFTKRHTFHSIRHTVVTMLKSAGVEDGVTSDIMGHKSENFTMKKYGTVAFIPTLRAAINKLFYPPVASETPHPVLQQTAAE